MLYRGLVMLTENIKSLPEKKKKVRHIDSQKAQGAQHHQQW